ncbi:MAG: DnaJ domain-containing protein [Deltaproteobacteria bacterium]|nr:DnaJ domain-containing protein [Deltaproteobacteria bacterium]
MEPINYFDVLGIDSKATIGEIKKAYRKLVFRYHPDYDSTKAARKNFIQATKAYKVLVDPVKKDEYIKGRSVTVTDDPWKILNNFWEKICERGFQYFLIILIFFK